MCDIYVVQYSVMPTVLGNLVAGQVFISQNTTCGIWHTFVRSDAVLCPSRSPSERVFCWLHWLTNISNQESYGSWEKLFLFLTQTNCTTYLDYHWIAALYGSMLSCMTIQTNVQLAENNACSDSKQSDIKLSAVNLSKCLEHTTFPFTYCLSLNKRWTEKRVEAHVTV